MKNIMLLFCLCPLLATAQNKYIVNNTPGSAANYNSLQAAINAVPVGSILYLMPSGISYGDAVIAKKLTIYGTGYFLGANIPLNTQANALGNVIVNTMLFRAGSDSSKIEGIQLADLTLPSFPLYRIIMDTVTNITISRCYFNTVYGTNAIFDSKTTTNCTVSDCYLYLPNVSLQSSARIIDNLGGPATITGLLFRNNIITSGWSNLLGIYNYFIYAGDDITFTNNLILTNLSRSTFNNLNYFNNILIHSFLADNVLVDPLTDGLGANSHNNITNADHVFIDSVNNYQNANADSMFVYSLPGYHSPDATWKVRDTSFAKTYGQGGIECGAYGGNPPYKLSGLPNLPYIYSMNVSPQVTAPGTLGVHIKAKASD
jgi:hypothetical protein